MKFDILSMKEQVMYVFDSNMHTALWGTESWEISPHISSPGVVAEGPMKGRRFTELGTGFNLLIKVIDAKTRLSVQVHPNEHTRLVTGGDPKTEMWCLLDDGVIYAGLKPGVGPNDIESAVKDGRFEELMVRHEAKKGDAFYIPGGLVHAIGDGTRLYEVQQSSDTTFRLYDWNRVGADGKARELHVEKARAAIDYTLKAPTPHKDIISPFFEFRQIELGGGTISVPCEDWCAIYAAEGEVKVGGEKLAAGRSALVSAGTEITGDGKIFITTQGKGTEK